MHDDRAIEWASTPGLVDYRTAERVMEERVLAIRQGNAHELVWLLEHPPLYTAGTSADPKHLTNPDGLPVHNTGRGGQYTYHGPGQRVAYVMLEVSRRYDGDVRSFVTTLEDWIIAALAPFSLRCATRPDRVGVWVLHEKSGVELEEKIAAIGIRIRHGVSFHGVSLNVSPDLAHYDGIVPCGIMSYGVTSLHALGSRATMKDVDISLRASFERLFGPVTEVDDPMRASHPTATDWCPVQL